MFVPSELPTCLIKSALLTPVYYFEVRLIPSFHLEFVLIYCFSIFVWLSPYPCKPLPLILFCLRCCLLLVTFVPEFISNFVIVLLESSIWELSLEAYGLVVCVSKLFSLAKIVLTLVFPKFSKMPMGIYFHYVNQLVLGSEVSDFVSVIRSPLWYIYLIRIESYTFLNSKLNYTVFFLIKMFW